jgi:hypothetical protein
MSDRMMRQSTMGDWDLCQRKVQYSLDPSVPYGTGEARVVGTAYHAGLEAYYSALKEGELVGMDAILQRAELTFWQEADAVTTWDTSADDAWERVPAMLAAYMDDGVWSHSYRVVGTEVAFNEPWIPGWIAHGTIDLVLQAPDGTIVLDDHKTSGKGWRKGKESARNNNQASWYSYWYWVQHGVMPQFCWSIMRYDGTFERRWSERNQAEILLVVEKARQIARVIDLTGGEDLPPNTSGWWCSSKFCDFWNRCPFGAAMDEGRLGDEVDGAE